MFWIFGKRGCLVGTVDLDECAAVLCGVGDGTKRRQQVGASGICPKLRIGMGGFVGSIGDDAPYVEQSFRTAICLPSPLPFCGRPYGCGEIFSMLDGA